MIRYIIILLSLLITCSCAKITKRLQPDELPKLETLEEVDFDELRSMAKDLHEPRRKPVLKTPESIFWCPAPKGKLDLSNAPKVDLVFVESDIREALLELSMVTKIPIVIDEQVEGLISAGFNGKDFETALKIILSAGGFSYKVMKDYIFVGTSIPETENTSFHLLSLTCLYKPNYLNPNEIIELLSPFYRPFVSSSKNRDYISVAAPSSMQDKIQSDILILDQPHGQVLLELTILEVTTDVLEQFGINPGTPEIGAQTVFNSILGKGMSFSFLRMMNLLKTKGMATVKAMPSIVTMDGHEANFSSMQTKWIKLGDGTDTNKKHEVNYGVELKIRPHILSDNMIRLDISNASVSDMSKSRKGEMELTSHKISNTVRIKDSETLILGGLLQRKKYVSTNGTTGLEDKSFFGHLFKETNTITKETEVLIVITPKLLSVK